MKPGMPGVPAGIEYHETKVNGKCPACGFAELVLLPDGTIACKSYDCEDRQSLSRILHEVEVHHVVKLTDYDFSILHPMRERVTFHGANLFNCKLNAYILSLTAPPAPPGLYTAEQLDKEGKEWKWTRK